MIVETQFLGEADVELVAPEVARELRTALGEHALQLQRVTVRLRQEPCRHACRIRALFRHGGYLMIQKRCRSLEDAVSHAIDALLQAVVSSEAHLPRSCGPGVGAGRARVLLLALPALGHHSGSLKSAAQLALRMGMTLHVLRVLPVARASAELSVVDPLVGPTREAERRLLACRATRAWCDQVLAQRLPPLHVAVRAGEFVSEAARHAQQLGAELISVPPLRGRSGSIVAALARGAGVPVLVARGPGSVGGLLAASDLVDETYPVLRKAAELARRESASVLLLHDVNAATASQAPPAPLDAAVAPAQRVEAQRQRLLHAARRWLPSGKIIVTSENDPARAIVEQAASSGVDTIVVGTRPRLARRTARTVAAQVVEAADRSVLVVPIDGVRSTAPPAVAMAR